MKTKMMLATLALACTTALSSCNSLKRVYITPMEAIQFAVDNYDSHCGDGYETTYTFTINEILFDKGKAYRTTDGGKSLEEWYAVDFDIKNSVSTLVYNKQLYFNSHAIGILGNALSAAAITILIGEDSQYGFTKTNNHIGYNMHTNLLTDGINIAGAILAIYSLIGDSLTPGSGGSGGSGSGGQGASGFIKKILSIIEGIQVGKSSYMDLNLELTRFGFFKEASIKLYFTDLLVKSGTALSAYIGDYIHINNVIIDLKLEASYK